MQVNSLQFHWVMKTTQVPPPLPQDHHWARAATLEMPWAQSCNHAHLTTCLCNTYFWVWFHGSSASKKKLRISCLPFPSAQDLPVLHNCTLGCGETILIEINSLSPLKILFIAQIMSKIWLALWPHNLGKEVDAGNTVVKMQKVFKLIIYYSKLFTLMIQSFTTTHWGERRRREPLAGLTNHQPTGQLWTTRAVRRGEKGCEIIANFPPHVGQPNTKYSQHICSQECKQKEKTDSILGKWGNKCILAAFFTIIITKRIMWWHVRKVDSKFSSKGLHKPLVEKNVEANWVTPIFMPSF